MLLVVGIGAIIIATTLIVMRQQKPQKRLWVDFASYGFGAAVMSWVAVSSFLDGERMLPAVAAVAAVINLWRFVQTSLQLRTPKRS